MEITIEAPGGLAERLNEQLPRYLANRADVTLSPTWVFDLHSRIGPVIAAADDAYASEQLAEPAGLPPETDKLLQVTVRWTPAGFKLSAREFDRYLKRWSTTKRRECRQLSSLPEQLFALATQTLSPLARIETITGDAEHVRLTPRGAKLPNGPNTPAWASPGDVFTPILRRTTRSGELAENGIQIIPWTYLEAQPGDNDSLKFRIRSGSRRPFSARRQARVEQIAIAVKADPAETTLQFVSRRDNKKPLIGYEVLAQGEKGTPPVRVAMSDASGNARVPTTDSRIQMLLVKHGGQLLARLPVVPGAEPLIRVPLPDDDARLAAEARLAAVREDLVDVVARRNILIARARHKIEQRDLQGAQELVRQLDDLPAKPQFDQTLTKSAQLLRSEDPIMQRRIDQLFKATQTLLTQFLDLKPINDLHDELREAQQSATAKSGKT